MQNRSRLATSKTSLAASLAAAAAWDTLVRVVVAIPATVTLITVTLVATNIRIETAPLMVVVLLAGVAKVSLVTRCSTRNLAGVTTIQVESLRG